MAGQRALAAEDVDLAPGPEEHRVVTEVAAQRHVLDVGQDDADRVDADALPEGRLPFLLLFGLVLDDLLLDRLLDCVVLELALLLVVLGRVGVLRADARDRRGLALGEPLGLDGRRGERLLVDVRGGDDGVERVDHLVPALRDGRHEPRPQPVALAAGERQRALLQHREAGVESRTAVTLSRPHTSASEVTIVIVAASSPIVHVSGSCATTPGTPTMS